jgi:integrase
VLAKTTVSEYRNTLRHFLSEHLDRHLGEVDFAVIDQRLSNLPVTSKTHNNIISCVRGLYDYAVLCKWVPENPTKSIQFAKVAEPEPDPLDRDEVEAVIRDMASHYHPQIANYFEGALWLGWRPSEGIALPWGNLDRRKGVLRISGARVRGVEKVTKTNRSRDVELDERALAIFERQRAHTHMKGDRIFTNPVTGENWWDTADLVKKYWRPSLKRLGIRDRDARQTRHTCATMLLMAGCNPAWCATQLGHSVEMFLRVYARWLSSSDKGRERAKLLGFSPQIHRGSEDSGKSVT